MHAYPFQLHCNCAKVPGTHSHCHFQINYSTDWTRQLLEEAGLERTQEAKARVEKEYQQYIMWVSICCSFKCTFCRLFS
jgi:hypothetical protein